MIFYNSIKKIFFSKNQNKAKFKILDDSEVISSEFPGLKTSAVSMASTASTTSLASMTSTTSFHEKNNAPDSWILPGNQMTNIGPFLWNGLSKIQIFTEICSLPIGGC
jgi:hypothetical protein